MEHPTTLAEHILGSTDVAFLATCDDDQPRLRPVNVAWREGFTLWIASYSYWGKIAQLQRNAKVEVCVMEPSGAHVRIVGHGLLCQDAEEKQRIYKEFPLMRQYFASPTDPYYALIKIVPIAVTVKDAWDLEYRTVSF